MVYNLPLDPADAARIEQLVAALRLQPATI
jgi:hypothetical protein